MNPKTKCAVWISDDVVQDETRTHGKLLPNKHNKEKETKTSKSTKDKSSKTKSSNAKLSKGKSSNAKSKILEKKKKIVNKHPKKTKH